MDCLPKNSLVHPAYTQGNFSIARPLDCVETSGAQVDNDCSGTPSNDNFVVTVTARGTISDDCLDLRPMFSIKYHQSGDPAETFQEAIAQRLGYSWNPYRFNVCGVSIDKIRVALTTNDGLPQGLLMANKGTDPRICNYADVTNPTRMEWDPDILVDSVQFGTEDEIKIAKLKDLEGTGTCRFPPTKERVKLFGAGNPYNTSGIVPTDGKTCSDRTNSDDCQHYNTCRWVGSTCETAKLCLNSPQVTGQAGTGSGGGSETSFSGEDCGGTPSSGAIRCNGYFEIQR